MQVPGLVVVGSVAVERDDDEAAVDTLEQVYHRLVEQVGVGVDVRAEAGPVLCRHIHEPVAEVLDDVRGQQGLAAKPIDGHPLVPALPEFGIG